MGFWGVVGAIIVAVLILSFAWKLKKYVKNPTNIILIIIVICLYCVNNIFLKKCTQGIIQYFFICYFNDLICPLFFLSYVQILFLLINKNILSLKVILFIGFLCGLVWELFAPLINRESITDVFDFFSYIIGSIVYYIICKLTKNT